MSYVIDAAGKVHDKQVAAATKSQDLFVKVVEKVAGLRDRAPQAPEALKVVVGPIQKVTAPVAKVFGDRTEVVEYVNGSVRDWIGVQQSFQNQLLDAVAGQGSPAPAAKSTSTRKSTAKKA
jgi:hypothetical protein